MTAARLLVDLFGRNRQRLHYIRRLLDRGYSQAEACAAWRAAQGGGFNLLLSLQQADNVNLGLTPPVSKVLRWRDVGDSGSDKSIDRQ